MTPARLVALSLAASLALLAPLGGVARADQTTTAEAIVDVDYGFRLDRPGPGWRLFGEADVSRMSPDALAGAATRGAWGAVIVERWAGDDEKGFARVVVENAPVEGKEIVAVEDVEYAGRKAVRTEFTGRAAGFTMRWVNLAFLHAGHAYQVVGWTNARPEPGAAAGLAQFQASFHLLPGAVRGRPQKAASPDATGPGWTLRGGVFSSASYGFRVTPPAGWRVVVGTELRRMNANAEVGLLRTQPEAYVILIPERVAGADPAAFAARLRGAFAQANRRKAADDAPVRVGDVRLGLTAYGHPDIPSLSLRHGIGFHGDLALQVLAWGPDTFEAKQPGWWNDVLAGFAFLGPVEAAALDREIAASLAPARAFGPTHSLRGDLLRDYAGGFTWKRPSTAWIVEAGAAARERAPDASLYVENRARGLFGLVLVEETDLGPVAFHDAVVRASTEEGAPPPAAKPIRLGDLDGYSSTVDLEDPPMRYRHTTLVRRGRAVRLAIWGLPGNMAAAEADVRAAIGGLRFPAGGLGPPTSREGDLWRDERAGYLLRAPGPEWRFDDVTPKELAPIGSLVQLSFGPHAVVGMAIGQIPGERGPDAIAKFLMDIAGSYITGARPMDLPASTGTLSGRPCLRFAWDTGRTQVHAFALVLDGTLFAALVKVPSGGDGPSAETLAKAFALLD